MSYSNKTKEEIFVSLVNHYLNNAIHSKELLDALEFYKES